MDLRCDLTEVLSPGPRWEAGEGREPPPIHVNRALDSLFGTLWPDLPSSKISTLPW